MGRFSALLCVQLLLASCCVTPSVVGSALRRPSEATANGCRAQLTQSVRPAWIEGLACGKSRSLVASEGLYGHSGAFQLLGGRSQQRLPADTFGEGIAYEPSSDTFFQLTLDDAEVWQFRAADLALIGRFPLPGAAKGSGMLSALKALESAYASTGDGVESISGAKSEPGAGSRDAALPSFEEQLQHTAGLHPEDAALAAEIAALAGGPMLLQLESEASPPSATGAGSQEAVRKITGLPAAASSAEAQAIKQAWGLAYDSTRRLMWLSDGSLRLHALASGMTAQLATVAVSFPPGVQPSCPHTDGSARSRSERGSIAAADADDGAAAAPFGGSAASMHATAAAHEAAVDQVPRLNELEFMPPDALAQAFAVAAATLHAAGVDTGACAESSGRHVNAGSADRHVNAGSSDHHVNAGLSDRHVNASRRMDHQRLGGSQSMLCTAIPPFPSTTTAVPSSYADAGEIWAAVPGCIAILRISACDFSAIGWLDFRAAAALPHAPDITDLRHCNDERRLRRRARRRKGSLAARQSVLDRLSGGEEDGRTLPSSSGQEAALIHDARLVASEITLRARREGHLNGLAVCHDHRSTPELFIAGKHWTALLQAELAAVLLAGGAAC